MYYALFRPNVIPNFSKQPISVDPRDRRARKIFIRRDLIDRPDLATWLEMFNLGNWSDIVDVGANYGEFLVAIKNPERFALMAFEPNPRIFGILAKTCKANRLNVSLENVAVGDAKDNVQFYVSSRQSGASSVIASHTAASHALAVPQVALGDYFVERYNGDLSSRSLLIKIDIEGHDLAAIRGLGSITQEAHDLAVLFEIRSINADGIAEVLRDFDIFVLGQSGNWAAILPPITPHSIQALRSELGFDDAVAVRKTSNSNIRSVLVSLVEHQKSER